MNAPTSVSIGAAASAIAAAQGVTQRCVSLATGTLSPDLRVNYEFGLVLGVDEFRQEQLYFLEKGYQHNRGLHGFGTVYGLRVSTSTPTGSNDDLQITVTPGMAIDQFGRAIVIRSDQCARLGAWLAKQVQTDPGVIERERAGLSGDMSVYVVLSYAECTDALVPIPGQPCSSAEDSSAPSRIRDSFRIELRWQPPAMPAWDAVRALAELLALVRPVRDLPLEQSDEPLLADLVRLLNDPDGYAAALASMLAGTPSDMPRALFRLPADTAGAALDRLYTIWATEVRPSQPLPPDLNDPQPPSEPGVLLARIDFLPEDPFDPQQPALNFPRERNGQPVQPDTEGRPFLLHTQLIQELRGPGAALEKREFATINARDGETLRVWVHYGVQLDVLDPAALELTVDSGPVTIADVTLVAPNVFDLQIEPAEITESPQGPPLPPGELIALRFLLDRVTASDRPIMDEIDTFAIDYLGRDGAGITVYTVATATLATVEAPPVREFVSVQTVQADGGLRFRLWFHTDEPIVMPAAIRTQRGVGPNATQHNFTVQNAATAAGPAFMWLLVPPPNLRLDSGNVLTFNFDTTELLLGQRRTSLADVLAAGDQQLIGYDGGRTVRAFHIVSPPATGGISEEQVRELIRRAISELPRPEQRPVMPFVTITPLELESPRIELWFHPTDDPGKNEVEIDRDFMERRPFQLWVEREELGEMVDLRDALGIEPMRPNVFHIFLRDDVWSELGNRSRWLRFVFFPGDMLVSGNDRQIPLNEYMERLPFVYEGALDTKMITAYTRLTQTGGA